MRLAGRVAAICGVAAVGIGAALVYRKFSKKAVAKGFDVKAFKAQLTTKRLGRLVDARNTVTSTMTVAAQDSAASHGKVYIAEEQTSGVGRRGRAWESPGGENLYFSFIWKPEDSSNVMQEMLKLNFAICIAVCRAAQDHGVHGLSVKWPNDVWYDRSKVAGMLVNFNGRDMSVAGVGINVNSTPIVENTSTNCLASIAGKAVAREGILASFMNHLETEMQQSFEDVLLDYQQFDMLIGKQVRVYHRARKDNHPMDYDARVVGYDKMGGLRVVRADNGDEQVLSGQEISVKPSS